MERAGIVRRERLLARLRTTPDTRVIAAIAAAGTGKTTLLGQLARQRGGDVAWVSLDDTDNDARQLLREIVAALASAGSLDDSTAATLSAPGAAPLRVVPRLTNALRSGDRVVMIVLDDIDVVTDEPALDVVALLVERLPYGSLIVLAGRAEPGLPLARWRAAGQLLEIGTVDLAVDVTEAEGVVRGAGIRLPRPELEEIVDATEGWVAGVYLAALARRLGGDPGTHSHRDDGFIAAYIDDEILGVLEEDDLTFLARTSILDEVSAELGNAVSGFEDAARRLDDLERRNLFVIPADPARRRFRYHALLRGALQRRLERTEAGRIPELHARAARCLESAGDVRGAIEHALRAGDILTAAPMISASFLDLYRTEGEGALQRWLALIGDEAIAADDILPYVAAWAAWVRGDAERADRWTTVAEARLPENPGARLTGREAALALLRAVQCRDGLDAMRADADVAMRLVPADDQWRSVVVVIEGIVRQLSGDADGAMELFRDVAGMPGARGTNADHMAIAELALDAMARRDWTGAEELIRRHRTSTRATGSEEHHSSLLGLVAEARLCLRRSDVPRARELLVRAQAIRPRVTKAMPYWSVRCLAELARTQLLAGDAAGAAASLRQAETILLDRPRLGVLADDVRVLRERLDQAAVGPRSAGSLTPAELRLLTLLQTHLTFKEMSSRLGISPNTAKTEAMSLYAKLQVTSRSEAVERAVDLGLLESVLPPVEPLPITRTRR